MKAQARRTKKPRPSTVTVNGKKYRITRSKRKGFPVVLNSTKYRTDDLRRFVDALATVHLYERNRGSVVIHFDHLDREVSRWRRVHGHCSGHAYLGDARSKLNAHRATITLPKGEKIDTIDLAHTIAHEMGHLRGLDHSDMTGNPWYRRVGDYRQRFEALGYADLELREREPVKKPARKTGADLAAAKLSNCEAKVKEWESKKRRAVNAERKWKQKAAYYRKRLAAMEANES